MCKLYESECIEEEKKEEEEAISCECKIKIKFSCSERECQDAISF